MILFRKKAREVSLKYHKIGRSIIKNRQQHTKQAKQHTKQAKYRTKCINYAHVRGYSPTYMGSHDHVRGYA